MKRMIYVYTIGILLILVLPGCGKLIDWGQSNFYQGDQLSNYSCGVEPYIRSVTIYDQFTTKAAFDAVWLSDEVRETYVQLHSLRLAKDEDRQNALLRRQLEENNHYISFYVFSLHEVKLGDTESEWSLFLKVGDTYYHSIEIKEIELPYEYQIFFGKAWNRFKVPYLVRFGSQDSNEMPLVTDETDSISLYFRSANKEHAFVWPLHSDEPEIEIEECKERKKKEKRVKQPKERVLRKKRTKKERVPQSYEPRKKHVKKEPVVQSYEPRKTRKGKRS